VTLICIQQRSRFIKLFQEFVSQKPSIHNVNHLAVVAQFSAGEFKLARIGYYGFGICVISFTLEQAFYLEGTASFVPKWIPPGQMFWAVGTTLAFAGAAIALLSGRVALLAARLLTAMIAGFGLLVWLPAPFATPQQITSWAGNAQNTAILGAAWLAAEWLAGRNRNERSPVAASTSISTSRRIEPNKPESMVSRV